MNEFRETAAVALWGQHADSFDAQHYMELGRTRPLVFLFCAMTCRMYDGKILSSYVYLHVALNHPQWCKFAIDNFLLCLHRKTVTTGFHAL